MRQLLATNAFVVSVGIGALCLGALYGWHRKDFSYFARCGAVTTAAGILQLAREPLSGFPLRPTIITAEGHDGTKRVAYEALDIAAPAWVFEQEQTLRALSVFGPWLTIVGTMVWAFGDLLTGPFFGG